MNSNNSKQASAKNTEQNSRASARGSKRAMASNSGNAIPELKLVDGKYIIVESSGVNTRYEPVVLLLMYYAHPNPVEISYLEHRTGYSGGITQFRKTVIQRLCDDGRAYLHEDTDEVSISPIGIHYVVEQWPEIFGRK